MNARITRRAGLLPLLLVMAASAPEPIDLPGDALFPESVSIVGNTAYVASLGTGGVLRVNLATRKVEPFVKPGAFGSGALFGVLADTRNKLLWTCTNDFSARGVTVAGADKGSWLKGFDLVTGEGKVSLALPGTGSVCNDMAVGKDGSVYVADTGHPRILRWKPKAAALDVWIEDAAFGPGGLDGLAFGGDGHLYINNVRTGDFYRVLLGKDGTAGKITKLAPSRPLESPDGMRPLGGLKFAVAEGKGKVSTLTVKGDKVDVVTLAEGVSSPTGVDVSGGRIWYVQGHVGALFNPASPRPTLPFRLTPLPTK